MSSPSGEKAGRVAKGNKFAAILNSTSSSKVTVDGEMSAANAAEVFADMCRNAGTKSQDERNELMYCLAVAYAFGTSAERNVSDVTIDMDGIDTMKLSDIEDGVFDEFGVHARRRFARGFNIPGIKSDDGELAPNFADLTHSVIAQDVGLRRKLAMSKCCSEDMAPYAFDYADKLTARTTGSQKRFIRENRDRNVNISMPEFYVGNATAEAFNNDKHTPSTMSKGDTVNPSNRIASMFGS